MTWRPAFSYTRLQPTCSATCCALVCLPDNSDAASDVGSCFSPTNVRQIVFHTSQLARSNFGLGSAALQAIPDGSVLHFPARPAFFVAYCVMAGGPMVGDEEFYDKLSEIDVVVDARLPVFVFSAL